MKLFRNDNQKVGYYLVQRPVKKVSIEPLGMVARHRVASRSPLFSVYHVVRSMENSRSILAGRPRAEHTVVMIAIIAAI